MKVICIKECFPVASPIPTDHKVTIGDILDMELIEDVLYKGTFYFKHPTNNRCYPLDSFSTKIPDTSLSLKERIYSIINHDLGRNYLFFKVGDVLVPAGEQNICCALRLSMELHHGHKIDFVIELAKFIEKSWTDIDVSEIQKKNIFDKLIEMHKIEIEKPFYE